MTKSEKKWSFHIRALKINIPIIIKCISCCHKRKLNSKLFICLPFDAITIDLWQSSFSRFLIVAINAKHKFKNITHSLLIPSRALVPFWPPNFYSYIPHYIGTRILEGNFPFYSLRDRKLLHIGKYICLQILVSITHFYI